MDVFELYSFFLFSVVIVYLIMFLISIRNSDGPLSSVFSLICLASAVYVLGAAFQFNSKNVEGVLFSQKLKYFGVSFISGLWLIFAYIVYFRKNEPVRFWSCFSFRHWFCVLVSVHKRISRSLLFGDELISARRVPVQQKNTGSPLLSSCVVCILCGRFLHVLLFHGMGKRPFQADESLLFAFFRYTPFGDIVRILPAWDDAVPDRYDAGRLFCTGLVQRYRHI